MTQAKKQDIIAKVTSFLNKLLDDGEPTTESSTEQLVEMLTIACVRGNNPPKTPVHNHHIVQNALLDFRRKSAV